MKKDLVIHSLLRVLLSGKQRVEGLFRTETKINFHGTSNVVQPFLVIIDYGDVTDFVTTTRIRILVVIDHRTET